MLLPQGVTPITALEIAVGSLVGLVLIHQLAVLPSASGWTGPNIALGLGGLLATWPQRPGSLGFHYFWRTVAWVSLGAAWGLTWALPWGSLLPGVVGQTCQVVGEVADLPARYPHYTTVTLRVRAVTCPQPVTWPTTPWGTPRGVARLTWNHGDDPPPDVRADERWQFTVGFQPLQSRYHPGGFDAAAWAYREGIVAKGTVRRGRNAVAPQRLAFATTRSWTGYRQALRERIDGQSREFNAVLAALAVADRSGLDEDQRTVFQRTGTAHLLAISGLHVGLMAAWGFFGGRWLWCGLGPWIPGGLTRWPAPDVGWLTAWGAAWGYSALTSGAISTQRALVMVLLLGLLHGLRRTTPGNQVLGLTALVVIGGLGDITAPLNAGFWLSFGAVALMFTFGAGIGLWGLQWRLWVGLLPLSLLIFGQVSLSGLVANLIAIPWVSLVTVPLALMGTLLPVEPLSSWLLDGADYSLRLLWPSLVALAEPSWAVWIRPPPPWGWVALYSVGVALLFTTPRQRQPLVQALGWPWLILPGVVGLSAWLRWLVGGALLLPVLLYSPPRPPPGQFDLTVLAVGEGLSAVIRTHERVLVYDTGPRAFGGRDGGETVADYLAYQGHHRVDRLILSHNDSQHVGGTRSVLNRLAVDDILTGAPHQLPAPNRRPCVAGDTWHWEGVQFAVRHPPGPLPPNADGGDAFSCVVQVTAATGQSALLLGDVTLPVQAALAAQYGGALAATVVLAPDQGRRRRTNQSRDNPVWHPALWAVVQPHVVVGSTQRPAAPAVRVLPQKIAPQWRNGSDWGAFTWQFRRAGVVFIDHRTRAQRYYWSLGDQP